MPMSRADKEEEVKGYQTCFAENDIFVVARNNGLTVAEMTELRAGIRSAGGRAKVTKNSLVKRALADTQIAALGDMFIGPILLASANDPGVAKAVHEFAGKHEKLAIVGGAMGPQILDKSGVETLARLPSLDELRGKLVGLLVAPARQIMGVVQAPGGGLARVIGAHASKGE